MKRFIDIIVSLLAIILLSPIILITALLIRVNIGSPIIFKQKRPGLNEEIFQVYKFRTMTNEVDKNGVLLPNEERLTDFGKLIRKTSMDEIPQLVNVLKGDMSFVGPRPLLVEYLPLYNSEQAKRHNVRPGITGWAQVNGRNNISWEKRFEYDVWYVKNQSMLLDLKILYLTILKVFKQADISPDNEEFVEKFKGVQDQDENK